MRGGYSLQLLVIEVNFLCPEVAMSATHTVVLSMPLEDLLMHEDYFSAT